MLASLHIENIAVIESSDIDFGRGFNVLTGETGAGKSIVIDSINAVLGERTPRDLIRSGCRNALVSAVFEQIDGRIADELSELGYDCPDGSVLVQRKISSDGSNSVRINGLPATVAVLKTVGRLLINIHGQHDNQSLLDPSTHIRFIDAVADNGGLLERYRLAYDDFRACEAELNRLKALKDASEQRLELLRYEISELEVADIEVGERDDLVRQRDLIRNGEAVARELIAAGAAINGDDDVPSVPARLEEAAQHLSNCAQSLKAADALSEQLNGFGYEVQEAADKIAHLLDSLNFEPELLEDIEARLDYLFRLSSKYGRTEQEMLDRLAADRAELDSVENNDRLVAEAEAKLTAAAAKVDRLADELTKTRTKAGKAFADKVCSELASLDMPGVAFICDVSVKELSKNGRDKVEFLISANAGEAPKPISKIASGGELSRTMLAIKSVLADKNDVPTLIFDEIDTGISGSAAQKVGVKLKKISQNAQVICVTHLAQIAALADSHYKIAKHAENGRTFTEVRLLQSDDRVGEVARIMSGESPSATMLARAKELIDYGCKL